MSEATRRAILAGGGLAALALAVPGEAAAPAPTVGEAQNLLTVMAFIAAWSSGPFDVTAVMARFIAPDAKIRVIDSGPVLVGPEAVAAAFAGYLGKDDRITVETQHTLVRGPVVITERVDTQTGPGKPTQQWPIVGVFVVKAGLIHEWTDYVVG